jgi:diguanylate cyclase (GGDEF)-like protein/hemerythrin-like metal-binding protein/PAS domain S-box-containing protein
MTAIDTLMSQAEIFPWSDNFATGIDSIDVQHHRLVDLLNQLAAHMAFGSNEVTLFRVFDELADYAVYHFQTEEAIWNQYLGGDSMTLAHTKTHQDFVAEVVRVRGVNGTLSDEQATEQMVSFLTHWLAFHILEDDTHMANIVQGLKRGESLERAKETAKLHMSGAAHMLIQAVLTMYDNLSARTMALLREINQRRRAEERLRLSNIIVESSIDAIFITNPQGLITEVNPAFCQSVQQAREALLGQTIAAVQPETFASDKGRAIWDATLQSGQWAGELSSRRPDGELETVWLKLSIIKDEVLETRHVVGMVSSISQLVKHHHTLETAANHDALTGLPNRRLLDDRLAQAIEHSKRNSTILAVCLLDLDSFKPINDTLGHAVGDQVLRVVAQRMTQALRGADTVARLGGDEFVVLLGDLGAANEARPLLERLLHEVSQPVTVEHHTVHVGASMGVMLYPNDCADVDDLLKYADVAMYVAKAQGKACFKFYSETPTE